MQSSETNHLIFWDNCEDEPLPQQDIDDIDSFTKSLFNSVSNSPYSCGNASEPEYTSLTNVAMPGDRLDEILNYLSEPNSVAPSESQEEVPKVENISKGLKNMEVQQHQIKVENFDEYPKTFTELKTPSRPPTYDQAQELKVLSYPKPNAAMYYATQTPKIEMQVKETIINRSYTIQGPVGGPMRTQPSRAHSNRVSPNHSPYPSNPHSRAHSPNLPFTPNVPSTSITRKPTSKVKKDEKERIHACPHPAKDGSGPCKSRFFRPDELKRHIKIHTGEKNYKCAHCPLAFARSDHLKTHTRTHTGEKPYPCQKGCDKRFARSDERLRHHQVHEKKQKKEQTIKQENTHPGYPQTLPVLSTPYFSQNNFPRTKSSSQIPTRGPMIPYNRQMASSDGNFRSNLPPAYHQIQYSHSCRSSPRGGSPINSYPPTPISESSSHSSNTNIVGFHSCGRCQATAPCQCKKSNYYM